MESNKHILTAWRAKCEKKTAPDTWINHSSEKLGNVRSFKLMSFCYLTKTMSSTARFSRFSLKNPWGSANTWTLGRLTTSSTYTSSSFSSSTSLPSAILKTSGPCNHKHAPPTLLLQKKTPQKTPVLVDIRFTSLPVRPAFPQQLEAPWAEEWLNLTGLSERDSAADMKHVNKETSRVGGRGGGGGQGESLGWKIGKQKRAVSVSQRQPSPRHYLLPFAGVKGWGADSADGFITAGWLPTRHQPLAT